MGCRILYDRDQELAALFCSTSDVTFGPVFSAGEDCRDADERAEAFLRWLSSEDASVRWSTYEPHSLIDTGRRRDRDPRVLSEAGLQRAYSDWLAQETAQVAREDAAVNVDA